MRNGTWLKKKGSTTKVPARHERGTDGKLLPATPLPPGMAPNGEPLPETTVDDLKKITKAGGK